MAGRDEPHGQDSDDWFDEPQPPRGPRARPNDRRGRADAPSATAAGADDWLGAGNARPLRRPRLGPLDALSERGRAIAALGAALVVLLIIGLAVGGVFSGSKPRTAASPTTTGLAGRTTAPTVTKPSRIAAPSVPLKPGDSGAQVKVLQRALASLGYSSGAIDGSYGPSTQNAVAKFQRAAGLTADGVVGPQTRRALRAALKSP
jgi:Putative peptidoglycan binding domain